jgi:hypothetical protein
MSLESLFGARKKGKLNFGGKKTIAPVEDKNVRTIVGKLLKLCTKNISFDLVPKSGVVF